MMVSGLTPVVLFQATRHNRRSLSLALISSLEAGSMVLDSGNDANRRDFLKLGATGLSSLFLLDQLHVCVPAAEKQKELLVDQVRDATKRGVQYLRDREHGAGNWEAADNTMIGVRGGWTALCMLALLNAGVRPDDPIIERTIHYLRQVDPTQTYVVALQTMVFAEAGRNEAP